MIKPCQFCFSLHFTATNSSFAPGERCVKLIFLVVLLLNREVSVFHRCLLEDRGCLSSARAVKCRKVKSCCALEEQKMSFLNLPIVTSSF